MKIYKVIGIMSGTSLDGLDLAYCHIWKNLTRWEFEIRATRSIPYDKKRQNRLKSAIALPSDELFFLHNEFGTWLGEQARQFKEEEGLEVDFISSHGHTVHHQPGKGLTFQLGSGQHLANASGIRTICDFRTNDVALGGRSSVAMNPMIIGLRESPLSKANATERPMSSGPIAMSDRAATGSSSGLAG